MALTCIPAMPSTPTRSPTPQRKPHTTRFSESSTSATSTNGTSPSASPKARQPPEIMIDRTTPPDRHHEEQNKASRRRMKRYVFDHSSRVDWKSIPTFDDAEDDAWDHSDLSRQPHMWCEASPEYRDHVVKKYREPIFVGFRFDETRIYNDGEDGVDMIG